MWFSDFETIPEWKARGGRGDPKGSVATLDHILPRALGAPLYLEINLTVMCASCNEAKADRHPIPWIRELQLAGRLNNRQAKQLTKRWKRAEKKARASKIYIPPRPEEEQING